MDEKHDRYILDKMGLGHLFGTWEEQWIEADVKLKLTILAAGPGRPTVVFIPGTAVYATCYLELMHGLKLAGFNVVGFDPRGQGESGGGRGDYTIMEHVAEARAVCDWARERFNSKIFVMGSSQGGIESFYLAATGYKIDGAVCHNIADLVWVESLRLIRLGPRRITAAHRLFHRVSIPLISAAASLAPSVKIPLSVYLDLKKEKVRGFRDGEAFIREDPMALTEISLRAFASIASTPLPRRPAEIRTPILLVHSTGDNIFPEDYVLDLFNQLPGPKEVQVHAGLPHLVTIEHVGEILPGIADWLNRTAGRT